MTIVKDPELIKQLEAMKSQNNISDSVKKQLDELKRRDSANSFENFGKGALSGLGQSLADMGVSALNLIPEGAEHVLHRQFSRIPHPQIEELNPGSSAESYGQTAGHISSYLAPGGGAYKAGKALYGSGKALFKGGSMLADALAQGATGGAIGYATQDKNRDAGATQGALTGVLASLPLTSWGASRKLNQANKLASDRGIKNLDIPQHLLEDARQYMPNNHATNNLFDKIGQGEYDKLFTLQSDLGKRGKSLTDSWLSGSDRLLGRDTLETRKELIGSIHDALKQQGHEDIAHLMQQGQKRYAQHMKIRPHIQRVKTILGAYLVADALGLHPQVRKLLGI